MDIIFAGGKFRAKSQFANIAKISSTRKMGVIQYANASSRSLQCVVHLAKKMQRVPTGYASSVNNFLCSRIKYTNI